MLVFAFTCLALILYGGLLAALYLKAKSEFDSALRNMMRRHRAEVKALREGWRLTDQKVERLALVQAGTPNKPGTSAVNPFQKNEEFHAQKLKQIVEVNGEPTRMASR